MTRNGRVRGLIIVYGLLAGLLVCGCVAAQEIDTDFAEGVKSFQDRSYDAAISKLEDVVEDDAENAAAWYYLGVARLKTDDLEGALEALGETSDLHPGRPGTQLHMGMIYEQLGAYDEAIRAYQTELRNRQYKNLAEVFNALGRVYYYAGRYRDAVETTTECLDHNENYVEAVYYRGLTHYEQAKYEEALEDFERAIEVLDEWDRKRRRLERLIEREGESGLQPEAQRDKQRIQEDLAQEYARAAEFAQEKAMRPSLYLSKGDTARKLEEWARARNSYREALDPDRGGNAADPLPHVKIGEAYFEQAKSSFYDDGLLYTAISTVDVAIESAEEAIALDEGFPPAHKTLGDIFFFQAATYISDPEREIESSSFDDALARYDEAVSGNPEYVAAYEGRAQTHLAMDAPDKAISDLQTALDLAPRRADLYAALARAHVMNEDYEKATSVAETALGLDYENAQAHNAAGLAAYYMGNLGVAREYFKNSIEADPTLHQSYTNLGNTLFQMGSWHRARKNYQNALEIIPKPAIANTSVQRSYLHYLVAQTYHYTRQYEREVESLNKALGLDAAYLDALTQLALAYTELGKFKAAEQALKTALEVSPGPERDAGIYVQMGRLYEADGRPFDAITAYGAAVDAQRDNLEAREALNRLTSG